MAIETKKLLPGDGAEDDRFGISVSISGVTAIVGAYRDDDNGDDSGSAYIFSATASGDALAMDFGSSGLWNVDTAWTWAKISGGDAEALTDVDLY